MRGSREIKADDGGYRAAVRWALDVDEDRVGRSRIVGMSLGGFEQVLLAVGERGVRHPPQRMGPSRKGGRETGKTGNRPRPTEER